MNYARLLLWGIFTLFVTQSTLNQAKVVSLAVLYHPTTNACIGLLGDRHYDIYDSEECHEEEKNDALIMPSLHACAQQGYTIYFEGNDHFLKALNNLNLTSYNQVHGLHALLDTTARNPQHYKNYKPIDPRSGGVAACIDLAYRFDDISIPVYNMLLDTLATQAEITHDPILCDEYADACSTDHTTVLNAYLYSPHGTYSICPCYVQHLLITQARNLYPDMTNISFTAAYKHICDTTMQISDILAPYTHQESPYQEIARTILQKQDTVLNAAHNFFSHWNNHDPDFFTYPFFYTVNAMGTRTGDIKTGCGYGAKTDAQRCNKKFYNQLIDTFADTTFAAHLLNTPRSFLYAGASHITTLKELLCSPSSGFICIYEKGNESNTNACTKKQVNNFFSIIESI